MSPGTPVRVLHIIPHDGIGGVEVAARSMLRRRDLPCSFSVLLIAGPALEEFGGVIETGAGSATSPKAQFSGLQAALRFKPDILICSLWRSVPIALAVKRLLPKTRLVFFLHAERTVHVADACLSWLAMRAADEVWADSEATLRARTVPNGKPTQVISFVTDRRAPIAERSSLPAPTFVSWTRLARQKGIDRALEFLAALVGRGIDARFDIWGPDGGERAPLIKRARDLGLGNRVRFPGPASSSDLPSIAAGHCFFLQLSRFEGMAMAVVEAMQMGLVPVTTAVGQMGTYVRPDETGVLIDADQMSAGIDSVCELLGSTERFGALRRNAADYWLTYPLYADDICRAAMNLMMRTCD